MDINSSTLPSTIDTLPSPTSHLTHTHLHGCDRQAQLTSHSNSDHQDITSNLSSLTPIEQLAPIQHDRPVDRISKYTALREQKFGSGGSMEPSRNIATTSAKPTALVRNKDSTRNKLDLKFTQTESAQHLNETEAQYGPQRFPITASTTKSNQKRRKNGTQQFFGNSREELILAEQNNCNTAQTLTAQVAFLVPVLPDGTHDIGKEISTYSALCAPAPYVLKARQHMIFEIARRINNTPSTRLPSDIQVVAFGSTQFNLDSSSSDLDLCICDPYLPRGPRNPQDILNPRKIYRMRTIAEILSEAGFKSVCPIGSATVPIVKFRSPDGTIAADLNCNNLLGCLNSALLKAYNDLSPDVFRPMGMAIKLWAKARGICDPSGSLGPITASSYTLVLMLIGYLQSIGHLPNLQDEGYITQTIGPDPDKRTVISTQRTRPRYKRKTRTVDLIQHDATFMVRPPPETWHPKPIENLSSAFLGFFQYYDRFDFKNKVISIRSGRPCDRQTCCDSPTLGDDEDPERLEKSDLNVEENLNTEQILNVEANLNQRENSNQEENSDVESEAEAEAEGSHASDEVEDGQQSKPKQFKRGSRRASKAISPGTPLFYSWIEPIAVEDPFIRARNTAKNIGKSSAQTIQMEIRRARQILERGGGLVELCEWHSSMALRPPSPISKSKNRSKGKDAEGSKGKDAELKSSESIQPVTTNTPRPSTSSPPAKPITLPAKPSISSPPPKPTPLPPKPSMSSYPPLPPNPKRVTDPEKGPPKFTPSWYAMMRRNQGRSCTTTNIKPCEPKNQSLSSASANANHIENENGKGKGKSKGKSRGKSEGKGNEEVKEVKEVENQSNKTKQRGGKRRE